MQVLATIKYLKENYEKIDPSYLEAPLLHLLMQEPPEEWLKVLQAPEEMEGCEERSPEEWQRLVEDTDELVEACKLLIEWIRSRRDAHEAAQQMRQYLASPPDQRQFESPFSPHSSKTQPPAKSSTPANATTKTTNGEDEAWEHAIRHGTVVWKYMGQGMSREEASAKADKEVPPYQFNLPFKPRDR